MNDNRQSSPVNRYLRLVATLVLVGLALLAGNPVRAGREAPCRLPALLPSPAQHSLAATPTPEMLPEEPLPPDDPSAGIMNMLIAVTALSIFLLLIWGGIPLLIVVLILLTLWIASSPWVARRRGRPLPSKTAFWVRFGALLGIPLGVAGVLLANLAYRMFDSKPFAPWQVIVFGTLGGLLLGVIAGFLFGYGRDWDQARKDRSHWTHRQLSVVLGLGFIGGIFVRAGSNLQPETARSPILIALGTLLVLCGVALWILASRDSGFAHRLQRLVTSGIHARTRNPVYLALILIAVGVAFFSGLWLSIIWLGMAVYVVRALVEIEEKDLEKRFGEDYLPYKQEVPRFLPVLRDRVRLTPRRR